jgi:mycothiol synthase
MLRPTLDGLPSLEEALAALPERYALRTYRPGDEAAWAEIMNTGIGSGWTAERCRDFLIKRSEFRPDGLFFAARDLGNGEEIVGTTCAWRGNAVERRTGIVHMVCVHPAHRGHRLGYALVLATLRYFRDHGFERAILSTDDFRLSAIRTYLDLGFSPDLKEPGHGARWAEVAARLARRGDG